MQCGIKHRKPLFKKLITQCKYTFSPKYANEIIKRNLKQIKKTVSLIGHEPDNLQKKIVINMTYKLVKL